MLPATASALVAAGLVLAVASGLDLTRDVEAFVNVPLALGFSTVAAGIWATRPDTRGLRRLGLLYTVVGLGAALVFPAAAWSHAAGLPHPLLPFEGLADWLTSWVWALGAAPILGLGLVLYPDGELPGRAWWPAPVAGLLAVALLVGSGMLPVPAWVGGIGFFLLLATAAVGVAGLVVRFRRAPRGSDLRGQIGAFALAAALVIVVAALPEGNTPTHLVLILAGGAALPATVASAVVRHRLLDPPELAARLDAVSASRRAIVTEREEERVRLRRELHDGVGPSLAAIGLGLRRLQHDVDPSQATVVTALADEVQRAVAEVRRLCDGLRPEALHELGLVPTLEASAGRLATLGGPEVRVTSEPLPPLPPAMEAAAYRILMEATTNAVRHSGARSVTVRLGWGRGLRGVVEDDGVGLPDAPRPGVGLTAMVERAEELGGEAVIERAPAGGTVVRMWLPEGDR